MVRTWKKIKESNTWREQCFALVSLNSGMLSQNNSSRLFAPHQNKQDGLCKMPGNEVELKGAKSGRKRSGGAESCLILFQWNQGVGIHACSTVCPSNVISVTSVQFLRKSCAVLNTLYYFDNVWYTWRVFDFFAVVWEMISFWFQNDFFFFLLLFLTAVLTIKYTNASFICLIFY